MEAGCANCGRVFYGDGGAASAEGAFKFGLVSAFSGPAAAWDGADLFGLPRAFLADIPVGEIKKDGNSVKLDPVFVYKP